METKIGWNKKGHRKYRCRLGSFFRKHLPSSSSNWGVGPKNVPKNLLIPQAGLKSGKLFALVYTFVEDDSILFIFLSALGSELRWKVPLLQVQSSGILTFSDSCNLSWVYRYLPQEAGSSIIIISTVVFKKKHFVDWCLLKVALKDCNQRMLSTFVDFLSREDHSDQVDTFITVDIWGQWAVNRASRPNTLSHLLWVL